MTDNASEWYLYSPVLLMELSLLNQNQVSTALAWLCSLRFIKEAIFLESRISHHFRGGG